MLPRNRVVERDVRGNAAAVLACILSVTTLGAGETESGGLPAGKSLPELITLEDLQAEPTASSESLISHDHRITIGLGNLSFLFGSATIDLGYEYCMTDHLWLGVSMQYRYFQGPNALDGTEFNKAVGMKYSFRPAVEPGYRSKMRTKAKNSS